MRYMFPLKRMRPFMEVTTDRKLPELQRFAERFLRFVMLVAVAFVKLVRALANYIRTHRHALAAMFARPIFRRRQQPRARPQAPQTFCHDKPVHFRADPTLQQTLL